MMIIIENPAHVKPVLAGVRVLPCTQPIVALNIRLTQMRALALQRHASGASLDCDDWALIYAEGLARRYGGNVGRIRFAFARDAREARVRVSRDDMANAIECGLRAFECCPPTSAYSVAMIGRRLSVTLKER